jgi:hypothetical protein
MRSRFQCRLRRLSYVACLTAIALCISLPALAQNQAQQNPTQPTSSQASPTTTAPALQREGEQALAFVVKREVLDPRAFIPGTTTPLPPHGNWSIGKERPASCPPNSENCLRIIYRVPETPVACEWVVLLQPDGIHGAILEQNSDSIRYMLRIVPADELIPLIRSRGTPLPARIPGSTVEIQMIVGTSGEPTLILSATGPADLRIVSADAAKQWVFRPLMAGNRPIPFQTTIKFLFVGNKVKTEP